MQTGQYNMIGYSNAEDRDAMLYKHKYLKYKAKYLQLEQMKHGGDFSSRFASIKSGLKSAVSKVTDTISSALLDNAVILAKKDLILNPDESANLSKSDNPLELKRDCMELQRKLVGSSHILRKSDNVFQQFTINSPLCAKSQAEVAAQKVMAEAKPIVSQIGTQLKEGAKVIGTQASESAKKIGTQFASDLGRIAEESIQKGTTELSRKVDLAGRKLSDKAELASRKLSDKADLAGRKLSDKADLAGRKIFDRILRGGEGGPDDVNKIIEKVWNRKIDANGIQQIMNNYKYDIVIQYKPAVKGPSTIVVTKLHVTEAPKAEPPRVEEPKPEPPRVEEPKPEPPRVEEPKVEPPKVEAPKPEPPRVEEPKPEPPRVEEPKVEPPRVEAPKPEPPRVEEPKPEPPIIASPKPLPQPPQPPKRKLASPSVTRLSPQPSPRIKGFAASTASSELKSHKPKNQ